MPASGMTNGKGYSYLGPAAPFIAASAIAHRMDPRVALAVAYGEGGFHKRPWQNPGGNGHVYGPYQLEDGGALPPQFSGQPKKANDWAWSPAGIDYAVNGLAAATRGMQGQAAIDAGVRNFEKPGSSSIANSEIQRDTKFYNTLHGSGGGNVTGNNAGTGASNANVAQGSSPGVAPGTVPNVFANCQGTGELFGFIPYPSPGGMACYAIGMAKVSIFFIGGLVVMGIGFYMMLPRGRANPLSKGTVNDVIKTGAANVVPGGQVFKSAQQQRLAADLELRKRNAADRASARAEASSPEALKKEQVQLSKRRAEASLIRAQAAEQRQRVRQMKEGTGPSFLNPSEEMQIARVKESNPRRRDRVKG